MVTLSRDGSAAADQEQILAEDWKRFRSDEPTNAAILAVSEDRLVGFSEDPFGDISRMSGVALDDVVASLQGMLRAGTIRRIRQTLNAANLASGALVAWQVPQEKVDSAFNYLFQTDPFSGHVVVRSTDAATPGANFRLWTTLKVPQGFSLQRHIAFLQEKIGAESVRLMPAKAFFVLGVGHVRRRGLEAGSKAEFAAEMQVPAVIALTPEEWHILGFLKRELEPEEIGHSLWQGRAEEAGVSLARFVEVAQSLAARGILGRFSTFLEHVKPTIAQERVTRYNALFHWRVPVGREEEAGREVGRFDCMTHAYWREGGPEFANVNIMGVAHGQEKATVLANKAAIDAHFATVGIPLLYTNVFWGGRSEIKPSEILPNAYEDFCRANGIDPDTMRDG